MATWLHLSKLSGYYESEAIPISVDGDGALTRISWDSYEPTDTSIKIYTSASFDGGIVWTVWRQCINGGKIPDFGYDYPVGNALLKFRAFLESNNLNDFPKLNSITFEFEPVIVFDNKGVTECTPEIWITMKEAGDFSLINVSKNNEEFKFVGLANGETVYVNNEREHIETDLLATYRYSNFNDNYLRLPVGKNILKVSGNAKIVFRYQFKF